MPAMFLKSGVLIVLEPAPFPSSSLLQLALVLTTLELAKALAGPVEGLRAAANRVATQCLYRSISGKDPIWDLASRSQMDRGSRAARVLASVLGAGSRYARQLRSIDEGRRYLMRARLITNSSSNLLETDHRVRNGGAQHLSGYYPASGGLPLPTFADEADEQLIPSWLLFRVGVFLGVHVAVLAAVLALF